MVRYCWQQGNEDGYIGSSRIDTDDENEGDVGFVYATRKIMAFIIFYGLYRYNMSQLQSEHNKRSFLDSFLVLPSYYTFLVALFIYNIVASIAIIAALEARGSDHTMGVYITYSLDVGFQRFFNDAPAFFFLRGSAGRADVKTSCIYGAISGVLAFLMYFSTCMAHYYHYNNAARGIYMGFRGFYVLVYAVVLYAPLTWVYKRPAFKPYAFVRLFDTTMEILVGVLAITQVDNQWCASTVNTVLVDGLMLPILLILVFNYDSKVRAAAAITARR
jgi:hypothetical protein